MAKKVILYGSADCPDCVVLKAAFDKEEIRYGYVDILAGIAHLKKFILMRDANPEAFKDVIALQKVGIPAVVVDDTDVYAEVKAATVELDLFR